VPGLRSAAAPAAADLITLRHLPLPAWHQSQRRSRRRPALECPKPDLI